MAKYKKPDGHPEEPSEQKVNILLVDDRPENLLTLEALLDDMGQNVVKAGSGAEALKCLLKEDFAVVLLDVMMPQMDGYETAHLIRLRERSTHTPIIFVTAVNKTSMHAALGYAAGAVDYLVKPFDPDALKSKVATFVELARNSRALEAEIARRQRAEEEVRELNEALEQRVRERTAEIEALNERLRRAMTETHHRVKNSLQVIASMVDMRLLEDTDTISPEDLRRLGTHIHTLAAVHEILTEASKADAQAHFVSARAILERLLPLLQKMAGGRSIRCETEDVRLSGKQGTALALITNELVSNAVKHGTGDIEVSLTVGDGEALLEVRDAGPGFPADFDPRQVTSTGWELVDRLSRWDLQGASAWENLSAGGARVTVSIPLPPED